MEQIGAVNQYETKVIGRYGMGNGAITKNNPTVMATKEYIFTLNLACGVTPFCINWQGKEYVSNVYKISLPKVTITHVFYRPDIEEYKHLHPQCQHHVLNGGLLFGEFSRKTLENDPTTKDVDFESFQQWCKGVYGDRIPESEHLEIINHLQKVNKSKDKIAEELSECDCENEFCLKCQKNISLLRELRDA